MFNLLLLLFLFYEAGTCITSKGENVTVWRQMGKIIIIIKLTNSMAYGTRRFNATFTRALQYRYPEPNQHNSPHWYISRSILIFSSHLHLGLPKGLFPVGIPVKIVKALLPSSILAPVWRFWTKMIFYSVRLLAPSWRTTSGRLYMTAYSIYLQLTSISGGLFPHPQPRGRTMLWWQEPTDRPFIFFHCETSY